MSKKTNTLLFILGATLFNVIVTVASFLVVLILFSKFLYPRLPENSTAWALPVLFIISIAASFLLYRFLIKLLMKKVDVEKYFDPIFKSGRPPRKS
jgi:hypothetical protein